MHTKRKQPPESNTPHTLLGTPVRKQVERDLYRYHLSAANMTRKLDASSALAGAQRRIDIT